MPANQGQGLDAATRRELRRLADEIALLKKQARRDRRTGQGAYRSVEAGGHAVFDDDGTLRTVVGLQDDGTYTTVDSNAPPPPTPADPVLSTQPGVLVVTSYGATVDGSDWPLDFARLEVHVGATSGFPVGAGSKVAEWGRDGGSVTVALDPGPWFVVLVAANTSGAVSPPTAEQSADVPPAATGSGGVATYATDQAPVGLGVDDEGAIWYDTSAGNLAHRWDGAAWVPLSLGAGGIADAAIETRHIGREQVPPIGTTVSMFGGAFSNLIHDPAFTDPAIRADRLASTGHPDRWAFRTNNNLFTDPAFIVPPDLVSGPWTLGPNVVQTYYGDWSASWPGAKYAGVGTSSAGVSPGALILRGVTPVAVTAGKRYTVTLPIPYDYGATSTTLSATVTWLDANNVPLGSAFTSADFSRKTNPTGVAYVTDPNPAPAGVANVRIEYKLVSIAGKSYPYVSPTGDDWLDFLFLPDQPGYRTPNRSLLALPIALGEYGESVAIGATLAEYTGPADTPGGEYAADTLVLSKRFPVDPDRLLSVAMFHQIVAAGDPAFDASGATVRVRFYDDAGNAVTYDPGSASAMRPFPQWSRFDNLFTVPQGAAEADVVADVEALAGTVVRVRSAFASQGGAVDPMNGGGGVLDGTRFEYANQATGQVLHSVVPDFDADTADMQHVGPADMYGRFRVWDPSDYVTPVVDVDLTAGVVRVGSHKLTLDGPYDVGLEIGRTDGFSSTPYIDFHSSASATDADARILCNGGDGTERGGTLYFDAAKLRNKVPFIITGETWHTVGAAGEPGFLNGFSAESEPVQFRKDAAGNVTIRGRCHVGTSSKHAFVLPPGYRPTSTADGVAVIGTLQTPAVCRIDTNGEVHFWFPSSVTWVGAPPPFSAI